MEHLKRLQKAAFQAVHSVHGAGAVAEEMEITVDAVAELKKRYELDEFDQKVLKTVDVMVECAQIEQVIVPVYNVVPDVVLVEKTEVRAQLETVVQEELSSNVAVKDPISSVKELIDKKIIVMEKTETFEGRVDDRTFICSVKIGDFEVEKRASKKKKAYEQCCIAFLSQYKHAVKFDIDKGKSDIIDKVNTVDFEKSMCGTVSPKTLYTASVSDGTYALIDIKMRCDASEVFFCSGYDQDGNRIGSGRGKKKGEAECAFYWGILHDAFKFPPGKTYCLMCGFIVVSDGHQERCRKSKSCLKQLDGKLTVLGDRIYSIVVTTLFVKMKPEFVSSGVITKFLNHFCSAKVQVELFGANELPSVGVGVVKDVHALADYVEALIAIDPKFRVIWYYKLKEYLLAYDFG